jgi:hypothetical protein
MICRLKATIIMINDAVAISIRTQLPIPSMRISIPKKGSVLINLTIVT